MRLRATGRIAGKQAMPRAEKEARSQRLVELRKASGMTQEQVAEASGGLLIRNTVNKLEKMANLGQTRNIHKGLGKAYGLPPDDVAAYIDGELSLNQLLLRKNGHPPQSVEDKIEHVKTMLEEIRREDPRKFRMFGEEWATRMKRERAGKS